MDHKIKTYQTNIKAILEETASYYKGTTNSLSVHSISDEKNNHFQLLMLGWDENNYIFQCLFHLDIIDSKIWIQWNDTAIPIEQELIKRGVSPNEVVLGLKHPKMRKFSDFAIT